MASQHRRLALLGSWKRKSENEKSERLFLKNHRYVVLLLDNRFPINIECYIKKITKFVFIRLPAIQKYCKRALWVVLHSKITITIIMVNIRQRIRRSTGLYRIDDAARIQQVRRARSSHALDRSHIPQLHLSDVIFVTSWCTQLCFYLSIVLTVRWLIDEQCECARRRDDQCWSMFRHIFTQSRFLKRSID